MVLDADERHRRRIVLHGERGTGISARSAAGGALRDGDGLVLEDGAIVRVDGKPEPLVEIAAAKAHELARLAWHLGNRHTDVQVVGEQLRIRRDHVLEEMLCGLGAGLTPIEAPFDPEHGAYGHGHDEAWPVRADRELEARRRAPTVSGRGVATAHRALPADGVALAVLSGRRLFLFGRPRMGGGGGRRRGCRDAAAMARAS